MNCGKKKNKPCGSWGHRGPQVRDLKNYQRKEDTSTFLKQWPFALCDIGWLWNKTSNLLYACHTVQLPKHIHHGDLNSTAGCWKGGVLCSSLGFPTYYLYDLELII